jgi:hypothetical protein
MKINRLLLFLLIPQTLWAQVEIPNCKDSLVKFEAAGATKKTQWIDSDNWVARAVEGDFISRELGYQIQFKLDFQTQESRIICYTPSSKQVGPINKTWVFPVTRDSGEDLTVWQFHLLINPNGQLGYWIQPLRQVKDKWSSFLLKEFSFFQVTSSIGVAQKIKQSLVTQEVIKVTFDK